ncbi:MAG: DUF411 domain-containing protein [Brevundimonas sp.]|jgi:hypothetical protein|uniref:Uncharacterized conserved protein n=1 Tax=Brevundimonas viscosa TaxID=871741 RepID=A0A1I6T088_9CAUL|nr:MULTISPECIES: DUF411 domain-containing protein [Brevundimonas]MBA4804212.1 DUF411 domain-containing protein [Brevundimonas sp.]MBN8529693.1 DUF411 domain-containing protein [Caulobacterales bacterium]SFS82654.1 Uncharacterized conserved protein [Brevundimonas viscosa]
MPLPVLARRAVLGCVVLAAVAPAAACGQARENHAIAVYKTPTCACCDAWISHLRGAGFMVSVNILADLRGLRSSHGLAETLASCHSARVAGYFVEGHVPAADIRRLLAERPEAVGIAVPGMPPGSPGMETPGGDREPYDTLLVLKNGATRLFARHNAQA